MRGIIIIASATARRVDAKAPRPGRRVRQRPSSPHAPASNRFAAVALFPHRLLTDDESFAGYREQSTDRETHEPDPGALLFLSRFY